MVNSLRFTVYGLQLLEFHKNNNNLQPMTDDCRLTTDNYLLTTDDYQLSTVNCQL